MILLKCALKKTSQKPSPSRIPLSGPRTEKQDYYSVAIIRENRKFPDLLVRKSGKKGIACREWDGDRYSNPKIISWADLKHAKMKAEHYLRGMKFPFDSASSLLWSEAFYLPRLTILKTTISQKIYNTRTPVRSDRIALLKQLVDFRLSFHEGYEFYLPDDGHGDNIITLMERIYGHRIYGHPQYNEYGALLLINLDSFVATNDIRILDGDKYMVTGKAVATIAAYEEENRRHLDNKKHNSRILWLTVILAIVGVLQIPYVQNLLGIGMSQ